MEQDTYRIRTKKNIPAYAVVSWDPSAPRKTVRIDGYYLSHDLAVETARLEQTNHRDCLLVEVVEGSDGIEIPNDLFYEGYST